MTYIDEILYVKVKICDAIRLPEIHAVTLLQQWKNVVTDVGDFAQFYN